MSDSFENRSQGNDQLELIASPRFRKNSTGDMERSIIWKDEQGTHTETTVIHKNVPTFSVIIVTAIIFLLIGAFIAGLILFARFGKLMLQTIQTEKMLSAQQTPLPTLEPPTQQPQDHGGATPTPVRPGSTDPSAEFGNNIPDLYSKNVTGVVIVQSYNGSIRPSNLVGTGTGFCISSNGYILTNAHVVSDADHFMLTTYDNRQTEATLIGSDVRTDVAVLKIEDTSMLTVLTIGDSSKVRTGDFVFAIGHPTGDELSFTATFGMVGAVNRSVVIDGVRNSYIQIDAAINPGNSGGPLFDMNGNVIGINSAKTVVASYDDNGEPISAEGLGFSIPINSAMEIARTLIDEGGIVRPGIGISTVFINEDYAAQYEIPSGALVYTIIQDGPGHLAGLKIDDIITEIDGIRVTSNDVLGDHIRTKSVGDIVVMTVFRDGSTIQVSITIGDLNEIGSTILNGEHGGEKYGIN